MVNYGQKRSITVKKTRSISVKKNKKKIPSKTFNYKIIKKTVNYDQNLSIAVKNGQLRSKTGNYVQKRSITVKNGHLQSKTVNHGQNGQQQNPGKQITK